MKKLLFLVVVMMGSLCYSVGALAQDVPQYEYATVCIITNKSAIFIKPDNTLETFAIKEWTSAEIRSGNNDILNIYSGLNYVLNKKAKEGWELVNTTTILNTAGWTMRRLVRK